MARALTAARRQANSNNANAVCLDPADRAEGVLVHADADAVAKVRGWVRDVRQHCKTEQHDFLTRVANRVATELVKAQVYGGPIGDADEPLRWVLHGGPGTGKSYAVSLTPCALLKEELFQNFQGWQHGVEFEVVSLQASMADALEADTLAVFAEDNADSLKKHMDQAQRALRWRWLLSDECSTVNAELLARLELKCRDVVRDAARDKYYSSTYVQRPFGGLNVLFSGGPWQLEPPSGTFLGAADGHVGGRQRAAWADHGVRTTACLGRSYSRPAGHDGPH